MKTKRFIGKSAITPYKDVQGAILVPDTWAECRTIFAQVNGILPWHTFTSFGQLILKATVSRLVAIQVELIRTGRIF